MSNVHMGLLGDFVSQISGGGTPSREISEYWSGKIPWVSVKDLASSDPESSAEKISEQGLASSASRLIPAGIPIVATRMAVGRCAEFSSDVAINQDLKAIFPKEEILDRKYLCHFLKANEKTLASKGTGSTVKGIRLEDLEQLPIFVPPLPEQKKIAEILSGIDKQIFAHERQLEKNQRLSKGVLSGILARFEEESKDSTRLVEDIFVETSTPETHDSETPLYSLTIEFGLVPKPDRYVRDFLLADKEKENYKLIAKGDFVMNPMNLRWGAISAFHKDSSAKISKYYTTFRARDDRASVRFYEFLFRSDQYLHLYERIATGSLIEKMRVHWSAFKKLEIPFPSLEEQKNFESLSSSLELTSSRTRNLIAKLIIFRSAVASDLLSGRKRVSI